MNSDKIAEFKFDGMPVKLHTFGQDDHISRIVLSQKTFYELDVLRRAQEFYIPGTAIIDIGSNIGNHTIFFSKILGARVYAFEPHGPSYQLLTQNITDNLVGNLVTAYQIGLGAKRSRGNSVLLSPTNMGQAQVVEADDGSVEIVPLDAIAIPSPIGLVKIDVEGQECAVLQGARSLLLRHQPDVFVEAATEDQFYSVLKVMLSLGYIFRGRYAWTPTYLFSHVNQRKRIRHLLRLSSQSPRFSWRALLKDR